MRSHRGIKKYLKLSCLLAVINRHRQFSFAARPLYIVRSICLMHFSMAFHLCINARPGSGCGGRRRRRHSESEGAPPGEYVRLWAVVGFTQSFLFDYRDCWPLCPRMHIFCIIIMLRCSTYVRKCRARDSSVSTRSYGVHSLCALLQNLCFLGMLYDGMTS